MRVTGRQVRSMVREYLSMRVVASMREDGSWRC